MPQGVEAVAAFKRDDRTATFGRVRRLLLGNTRARRDMRCSQAVAFFPRPALQNLPNDSCTSAAGRVTAGRREG